MCGPVLIKLLAFTEFLSLGHINAWHSSKSNAWIVVIIEIAGVQCSYVTMTLNPILCVQQRLDLRVT